MRRRRRPSCATTPERPAAETPGAATTTNGPRAERGSGPSSTSGMFDIGFSKLFMIAVVALVVLGPKRLPHAAKFAGLWVRRARAQWHSVKSDLERELA